uniref:Reverse transcriptase domain-containing protein n=1 Tax=Tanacetum cinerariifolium TaxID=118510 RepID=A0A699KLA1_TANCI|nr:hypothetical protein [Tanacetum cinerariifolium]
MLIFPVLTKSKPHNKESLENPFNEIVVSKPDNESNLELEVTTDTELSSTEDIHPLAVQEPPQDFDIRQLIREECCVEVHEQQKQKIEDTMIELVKICQEKEFLCIHDDVDNLIESALDSKLLLINSNPQLLDKKEQEVKNVVENPAEHRNRNEIECDMPAKDDCSPVFTTFSNPLFKDDDNFDSSDEESLPDADEEIRLIENLLYDNSFPRPPKELNAKIADTIIDSIPLPIPVQDGNSQQEDIDIVTETDDVLPPSIENFADDPEGDICFLEELLINDSILSDKLSDANFKDNPLIPRPPPKPPDVESDAGEEIAVVMIDKDKFDDDYQIFMFDMVFSLLSAKSEDTIFDPGLSPDG